MLLLCLLGTLCLLLRPLWLRLLDLPLRLLMGLSAPLLRWVLLSALSLLLLRLLWLSLLDPRLLLSACLRLLRLSLRALLLCGWQSTLLLPTLLLFRLALFFVLLVVLRVRRDNRPEKQQQGSGTGSSNELHSNRLR